jgi:hypothetical protein
LWGCSDCSLKVTKEQINYMALSKEDRDEIVGTIRLVVNGNINRVEAKLDGHIQQHSELVEKLEPVIGAAQWVKVTKKLFAYLMGVLISIASLWALIK